MKFSQMVYNLDDAQLLLSLSAMRFYQAFVPVRIFPSIVEITKKF